MNEKSEWNIATYDAFLFPCQIKTLQKPVPVDDFRIRFFNKKTVSQKCGKKNTKLPQEHILSRYPVTLKSGHLHFWRAIALLHRHIIVSIQHPIGLRSTKHVGLTAMHKWSWKQLPQIRPVVGTPSWRMKLCFQIDLCRWRRQKGQLRLQNWVTCDSGSRRGHLRLENWVTCDSGILQG